MAGAQHMELLFKEGLSELSKKSKVYVTFTKEQYFSLIEELKGAKSKKAKKSKKDYDILSK